MTFLLLIFITPNDLVDTILILAPALIASFLVLPIPNYHNVLEAIISIKNFYSNRQKYIWRGWCIYETGDEDNTTKKQF